VIAVDRLRVPVNRVVRLELASPAHDVIHSWWIPALGGKQDTIPGQVNETWFEIDQEGIYRGQCAELCGIQHGAMLAAVEALPEDEFERWLEQQAGEQESPEGETVLGSSTYRGVCAKCHGFRREGLIGPPLTQAAVANEEAIEELVRNGRGGMPAVGKGWDDRQVSALIAYLKEGGDGG
jgi:cytochrome c oxidase subunit 2